MNDRFGIWVIVGTFAATVTGGAAMVDQDPAVALHETLVGNEEHLQRFDRAKDFLYEVIDNDSGEVVCVYSNTRVAVVENDDGTWRPVGAKHVQAEHTWPCKAAWAKDEHKFLRDSSVPGADLHHIYPARSSTNSIRSNHRFGVPTHSDEEIYVKPDGRKGSPGNPTHTASGSVIGKNDDNVKVFMPREEHRSNTARAILHMSVRYWLPVEDKMEDILREWHEDDPVDQAEIDRNDRVEEFQHNRNPFVDDPSLVDEIDDF